MKTITKAAVAGTLILALAGGTAYAVGPHRGGWGPCAGAGYTEGMGGSGMMMGGPGMMMGGAGMIEGMGPAARVDKNLTTEDARSIVAGRLAMSGNKRLKVGEVQEKDGDTILAEVVTVDNSLVRRLEIDRHSGRARPIAE